MSIVNLQRDAAFVELEKAPVEWGTKTTIDETNPLKADADPTVYDIYAVARSDRSVTTTVSTALEIYTFGLFMRGPGVELTPYRVKARAQANKAGATHLLAIGYAEDTITGTDDEITFFQHFSFIHYLDELFLIKPPVSVGDKPLFFGISTMGAASVATHYANLSVQRLSTSPPSFSQSVS